MACWDLRRGPLTRLLSDFATHILRRSKLVHYHWLRSQLNPPQLCLIHWFYVPVTVKAWPQTSPLSEALSWCMQWDDGLSWILYHDSKGFFPWHFRRRGRRKLKTCSPSAAPDRVISLAVPAGAFPMSFKFLYSASLCPKDKLSHAWHLPDLVLAGGILFSRFRSGVWSPSLFLQWPFCYIEQYSISQNFNFFFLVFWISAQQVPLLLKVQCWTRHATPGDTLQKQ